MDNIIIKNAIKVLTFEVKCYDIREEKDVSTTITILDCNEEEIRNILEKIYEQRAYELSGYRLIKKDTIDITAYALSQIEDAEKLKNL